MNTTTRCMYDLSHNDSLPTSTYAQDKPLFQKALQAGWPYMMHKLTQGSDFVDRTALGRIPVAVDAGLMVGGYHYMDGTPVTNQIANFMMTVGLIQGKLPENTPFVLSLDFEYDANSSDAEQAVATTAASQFVSAVRQRTNVWPLVYTGRWYVNPKTVVGSCLPACPLWLSEYGTTPICPPGWVNWAFHQYSDGQAGPNPVNIPGIGSIDQSTFAGSLIECISWWKNNSVFPISH